MRTAPPTGSIDRRKAHAIAGIFVFVAIICLNKSEAAEEAPHFPAPVTTDTSCEFKGNLKIDGVDAESGDEVAFFDGEGVLCGRSIVLEGFAGRYLFAYVFGDDPTTPHLDEGAQSGEELIVKVWDASEDETWGGACLALTGGVRDGSYNTSPVPPVWQSNGLYVLDIQTESQHLAADINRDCSVDLMDALLALRIAGGTGLARDIPGAGDVNTDQRLGLEEVVYILQRVAGIR